MRKYECYSPCIRPLLGLRKISAPERVLVAALWCEDWCGQLAVRVSRSASGVVIK